MKSDPLYVQHMLDAIQKIERYLSGADFEVFSNQDMMIDAVVRKLEIVGEAASKCSTAFKNKSRL